MVDTSAQEQEYLVTWSKVQKTQELYFPYGGLGETVLLNNGEVIDFIRYPAGLGYEKMHEKIKSWFVLS